jgi:outer membrane protein OmpA-like peptidoglycan-associated protein
MFDKCNIVSGDFEGNFYTNQSSILSISEFNSDDRKHDIHLYRGELHNVIEESDYNLEMLRNRESFLLHNVTNIQINLNSHDGGLNDNRIYNFEQVLLRDAVIKESWQLNGKTYGIITGKFLGKIKDQKLSPDPSNPEPKPNPTPPDKGGGGIGSGDKNGGCLNFIGVLGTNGVGCLSNIWRLLLALLMLGLILWFLRGCWGQSADDRDCCNERDKLKIENERLQTELDSMNSRSNFLKDSVNKEDIQKELDALSSKVYFYGNTTKIRKVSDSQIDKIVAILQNNQNLTVEVRGYHNGEGAQIIEEYNSTIDVARAKHIKNLLVEKGVNETQISAVGMGESNIDPSEDSAMQKIVLDGEEFKWNRNMRVEIKIIKF